MTKYPGDFDLYALGTDSTAIYREASCVLAHSTPSKIEQIFNIFYAAAEASNEAGEILGEVKKILRDDNGSISHSRIEKIELEIGDTVYGLARLCRELGLSFSEIIRKNEYKLADRKERGVINGSGER